MRFLGGFILGLAFAAVVSLFSGCAGTGNCMRPHIGTCEMPMDNQDGFVLIGCTLQAGQFDQVACVYIKAANTPQQKLMVMTTEGCQVWKATFPSLK